MALQGRRTCFNEEGCSGAGPARLVVDFEEASKKKARCSLRDRFESFEPKPTKSIDEHIQQLFKRPRDDEIRVLPEEIVLKKHRVSKNVAVGDGSDSEASDERVLRDHEAELFMQSSVIEGPYVALVLEEESEGIRKVEVPASINSRLLAHQREGVKFLYRLYRANKGGILGDDMGLGKTIQTIAFLSAILDKGLEPASTSRGKRDKTTTSKVVLVLCPTTVIDNWQREFEEWGDFDVGVYHGTKREAIVAKVKENQLDVVLTSHDTFRIHGDSLLDMDWDCVIVDEAHRLKNEKSKLYKACVAIPTMRKYGLTGTILQNKFLELFNVFQWAAPGCLGTKEYFRNFYDEPIKQGQRISAPELVVELAEKRKVHLLNVLKKYLLRRTKDETIGHLLQGKEDIVIFCSMSPVQKRVYARLLESPDFQCLVKKDELCQCGSGRVSSKCCLKTAPNGSIWKFLHRDSTDGCKMCPYCLVLPCLTKLQQVSNHLELLKPKPKPKDEPDKRKRDEAFAALVFGEDAPLLGGVRQTEDFVGLSDAQHCGKMLALTKLLATWTDHGDKVLLFSYSVRMLEILEKFLIRKGYSFNRLDGSTPMCARQALVDDFNTTPSKQVFLISTRAGGLGLNLVSANRVVIFDPNWNPAQDLQAQDRSFRFGQKRHVTVFRLLAAGSLEELVYSRQIYKQQLFNIAVTGTSEKRYFEGVQDSKKNQGELFGVSNLFRDLKESIFTSEIIAQHQERMVKMKVEPKLTAKEVQKLKMLRSQEDDEEDEHGLNVLAQLVKADMKKDDQKEDIARILTGAGVVYAHRNEEVVNMHAPERVEDTDDVEDDANGRCTMTQAKGVDSKKAGKKIQRNKGVKLSLESAERPIRVQDDGAAGAVEGKRQQFLAMAKLKGMDEKAFSKWLLSASQAEREALLAEHKKASKLR